MARYEEKQEFKEVVTKEGNKVLKKRKKISIKLIGAIVTGIIGVIIAIYFLTSNDGRASNFRFADSYYINASELQNIYDGEKTTNYKNIYVLILDSSEYENGIKKDNPKLYTSITNLYTACKNNAGYMFYIIELKDIKEPSEYETEKGSVYDGKTPKLFIFENDILTKIQNGTRSTLDTLANNIKNK